MKLLTAILVVISLSLSAFARDSSDEQKEQAPLATQQQCEQMKNAGAAPEILAGQGCCSHHQGQCGCQFGRVVCCDGNLSPSCTCSKEEAPVVTN